jgi:epoxide hydrolase
MKAYRIDVPDAVLTDLRRRLDQTRWPEPIPGAGWKYGADTDEVRAFCDYWAHEYDWRTHEARLNRIPQFLVNVDGVDIHFFQVRARSQAVAPLLLLHGWPGSSFEFAELIEPLSDPEHHGGGPAFDLVIPSMPGFGFSGKPREAGWHADRVATAYHELMTRHLGYRRFGVQGGDWGSIVGTRMAHLFPESLRALHINMPTARPPADADPGEARRFATFMQAETGYLHLQSTKPDALTLALADSPAGLAAWILEKFRTWSDCRGDLLSAFSKDTLLTNLMFYWAPNSIASATRIYYESAQLDPPWFLHPRIMVPTGVAAFPKEPYRVPRSWVEPRFNIVWWTDMPAGGHFPALEQPQLLLEDIRKFFTVGAA